MAIAFVKWLVNDIIGEVGLPTGWPQAGLYLHFHLSFGGSST